MADPTSTAGSAQQKSNQSIENFAASLSTAAVVFGIQFTAFLILSGNWKIRRSKKTAAAAGDSSANEISLFQKIYYYKTAFVPKARRMKAPVTAIDSFKNVFTISDAELVRIAGVDGYLFLQYLQLLLRIFIPMAMLILPILLPINRQGDVPGVSGLDSFSWPNVGVPRKVNRLWAHLILAVCVVLWVCFNFYLALRKFIRLRQTILTMPEHRIRASATTILVQSIPKKWLTVPALDALYDVFPGGVKDIWINRDFDDLQEKIDKRTKIARQLEAAETALVLECTQKHREMEEKAARAAGAKKSRKEKKAEEAKQTKADHQQVEEQGLDAGNPHQIENTLQQVLQQDSSTAASSPSSSRSASPDRKRGIPIALLGQGLHAVGGSIRDVGRQGVSRLNKKLLGGVKITLGEKNDGHEGDSTEQQLDGNVEQPGSASTSPDPMERRTSTDTFAPLAAPSRKDQDSEGITDPSKKTTSSEEAGRREELAKQAKSGFHPWRKVKAAYSGQGDFVGPQPRQEEGDARPMEIKNPENIRYDMTGLYDEAFGEDSENAVWRKYVQPVDRETMRVPLFDKSWWPSIPLVGRKVDTIYYCRKELARLNLEIADDQAHPERFPLMNSAFIQFNHQVAAHMACQSTSHHTPRQMVPRTVEVNPNYVLWDHLTMKWWERYIRMLAVLVVIVALIIFWGIPVGFTGALSQIRALALQFRWLHWILSLPEWLISFIQGVLPPAFLALLFVLLPIVLRLLADLTGPSTAGEKELLVQNFYFAFVFVQLFLVVSISSGITSTIHVLLDNPISIPQTLAQNLPKSANYFFSYMILQALSISSGTLLQIGSIILIAFFHFFDTTPREKVSRILTRSSINWGTMIPVYTNFGSIGLVYSIVSPLILIMMLITFCLFWFTYRYQMIYVSYAKAETNGLIFPKAVNQLFTGLYFLELCLIGLFFLQRDLQDKPACVPQAIIMIVTMGFTVMFQFLLDRAFGPLYTYLPITFEDEAVKRDEEWQRAQESRWHKEDAEHQSLLVQGEAKQAVGERDSAHAEEQDEVPSQVHRQSACESGSYELDKLDSEGSMANGFSESVQQPRRKSDWATRSRHSSYSHTRSRSRSHSHIPIPKKEKRKNPLDSINDTLRRGLDDVARPIRDLEAQVLPSKNIFDDIDDELADIEPEARQKLIKRSFQHPASRALQPAVWIPHDDLGVAKDEIQRTSAYTKKIWITSINARLDAQGRVAYRGLPPDRDPFENIEI